MFLQPVFTAIGLALLLATLPLVLERLLLSLAALLPAHERGSRHENESSSRQENESSSRNESESSSRHESERRPRHDTVHTHAKPFSHASRRNRTIRLAVLVPAHNEEKRIGVCVSSLLASPNLATIFVIAHNCIDRTADEAARAGATVLPFSDDGLGGRPAVLRSAFAQTIEAGFDAALVIDAGSTVSPRLLAKVMSAFAAGAAAVQCRPAPTSCGNTKKIRFEELASLSSNALQPRGRSRLGLSCGIFNDGFALSANAARRVPYMLSATDDALEYHLQLVQAGVRVDFLEDALVFADKKDSKRRAQPPGIRTSSDSPSSIIPTSSNEPANSSEPRLRSRLLKPTVFALLRGHLKLIEPLLDLLSLPSADAIILLAIALLIPLTWLRTYAVTGLATMLLYGLVAVSLSTQPLTTLKTLTSAPAWPASKRNLASRPGR